MNFIDNLLDLEFTSEYLKRINAEPRTLFTALVEKKLTNRYWQDRATIKFSKSGVVSVYPQSKEQLYLPTDSEQSLIKTEWQENKDRFPEIKYLPLNLLEDNLSDELKDALDNDNLYIFEDKTNQYCLMLEQRLEHIKEDTQQKRYVRWSYWSDNKWRRLETTNKQGKIPLYGLSQLKDNSVVFLHEGAKAAEYCKSKLDSKHPWYKELSNAAHIAWVGGALNPHRTAWKILRDSRPDLVIIVPDNDSEGYSSVSYIAEQLDCITLSIQWPDTFPLRFDLADEFPEKMFMENKSDPDKLDYIGNNFKECTIVSTYLTRKHRHENSNRVSMVLRRHVKNLWIHILKNDLWMCRQRPDIILETDELKKYIRKYHHNIGQKDRIIDLFLENQEKNYMRFSYRPDKFEQNAYGIISDGQLTLNRYTPSIITARKSSITSDYKPWEEFLEHLFPIELERLQIKRWISTLVSAPQVKMKWGLLCISHLHGAGKSTLGENVLMPLIGKHNTSVIRDRDILGQFNGWAAYKRLIIIQEIYSGSWRPYQKLQSIVADDFISIEEKFQSSFICENWCHFYACSNKEVALKIPNEDRRWFIPEIAEEYWGALRFSSFYDWLSKLGLHIIRDWADKYPYRVHEGEHAPTSERKDEIIQQSMSEEIVAAHAIGEWLANYNKPFMLTRDTLHEMVKRKAGTNKPMYDSDVAVRRAIIEGGTIGVKKRKKLNILRRSGRIYKTKHNGRFQYILINKKMFDIYDKQNPVNSTDMTTFVRKAKKTEKVVMQLFLQEFVSF